MAVWPTPMAHPGTMLPDSGLHAEAQQAAAPAQIARDACQPGSPDPKDNGTTGLPPVSRTLSSRPHTRQDRTGRGWVVLASEYTTASGSQPVGCLNRTSQHRSSRVSPGCVACISPCHLTSTDARGADASCTRGSKHAAIAGGSRPSSRLSGAAAPGRKSQVL